MLVYDLEISTPLLEPEAKMRNMEKEELRKDFEDKGIKYAEHWRDFEHMEIACVATCDISLAGTEEDRYRVFMPDTFGRLVELLNDSTFIAGFNSKRFDNEVVKAHLGVDLTADVRMMKEPDFAKVQYEVVREELCKVPRRHYDVLEQIWFAKGLDPDRFAWSTHGGVGLDAVCACNFGLHKTGRGDRAPFLWLAGHYGEVMNYCLQDVWLTVKLIKEVMKGNGILDPTTNESLRSTMQTPAEVFGGV